MMLNNTLKVFLSFFTSIFIISFSIAFVILFRPYYYLNIKLLDLEKETGYTYEEIQEAYDDVMDYLVFGEEFKTGSLSYTESGKDHFADCRKLFTFDFICVFVSFAYVLTIFILQKKKIINLEFQKLSPGIYSIISTGAVFFVLLVWGIIDFDSLFTVFHLVCFPGKDNWIFSQADEIINILPTELWINFCILIVLIITLFIVLIILYEIKMRKKRKNI